MVKGWGKPQRSGPNPIAVAVIAGVTLSLPSAAVTYKLAHRAGQEFSEAEVSRLNSELGEAKVELDRLARRREVDKRLHTFLSMLNTYHQAVSEGDKEEIGQAITDLTSFILYENRPQVGSTSQGYEGRHISVIRRTKGGETSKTFVHFHIDGTSYSLPAAVASELDRTDPLK